jgi:hypothetical protein
MKRVAATLYAFMLVSLASSSALAGTGEASWKAQGIADADQHGANAIQHQADLDRDAAEQATNSTDANILSMEANDERNKAYKRQESAETAQHLSEELNDN